MNNESSRKSKVSKDWAKAVIERDGNQCQHCGTDKALIAHHIVPWDENVELRFVLENGLCLCRGCHMLHHDHGHRIKKGDIPWNKGIVGLSTGMPKGSKFSEEHKDKLSGAKNKKNAWYQNLTKNAVVRGSVLDAS